jgi:galactofuranosylgalactofuranosylrhamnosyl-N-acetylglucosaminyl-diphospho-decaprenol beta-1,5/1,6-galactofuranosyltransferase
MVRGTDSSGAVSTLAHVEAIEGDWQYDVAIGADSAWLWCDVVGRSVACEVHDVRWEIPVRAAAASLTVCITTFDRQADCVRLLERIAGDEDALSRIDRIVVADQGSHRVRDAEGFGAVSAALGDLLRVVEQPNLGGSGGFSRGMIDALEERSSHALVLDDDVDLEPESLRRLAVFAQSAVSAVIVGAQMLSLTEPTRLHSFGERVSRRGFWWGPVDPSLSGVDLTHVTVENTPSLSRRIEVDFNGWWMCLIPVDLIRAAGASLPFFIKWDDAEFGLRAAARGVPTVTLPGAALWHMPWTAKDDGLDWQAYFQLRNRVVTALIHGRRRGGGVLSSSFAQDVNHILCAQYGSAALRNLALRDILHGPAHLDPVLRGGPARATAVLTRAGQVTVPFAEAPAPPAGRAPRRPRGAFASAARAAAVLVHQLRRSRPDGVQARLSRDEGKWWSLGVLDSALVDSAAGDGVFLFRRDRRTAARLLRRALALRWRMWWRWPGMARRYRAAAPSAASAAAWRGRFTGSAAGDT